MQTISAVPRLMDVNELAALWRVSPHTIRAWVQQKRLEPLKICRRLLFHPDECARFLAAGNRDHQGMRQ
jgi:Helix-turn-helix domain